MRFLALVATLLCFAYPQARADSDWQAEIAVDRARVRSEPNTGSEIVSKLKKGTKLRIRFIDSEWLEILAGPFPNRFLSKDLVKVFVSNAKASGPVELSVETTTDTINLHDERGGKPGKVSGLISKQGEKLEIHPLDNEWAVIDSPEKFKGKVISVKYLELIKAPR